MVSKLILCLFTMSLLEAQPKTILFFGDSLTAGYGISPDQAFPAIVEQELNHENKKVKVINAGLSGETSAGGLSRIDWTLRQPIDIFILELGANDGLRGLPLQQTQMNLQGIIEKVKAKYPKVKIILAGMLVPPNMGTQYGNEFKKIYPALADKNKVDLIPFLLEGVAGIENLNQADGIHPNVKGHKIVADHLVTYLRKLI